MHFPYLNLMYNAASFSLNFHSHLVAFLIIHRGLKKLFAFPFLFDGLIEMLFLISSNKNT